MHVGTPRNLRGSAQRVSYARRLRKDLRYCSLCQAGEGAALAVPVASDAQLYQRRPMVGCSVKGELVGCRSHGDTCDLPGNGNEIYAVAAGARRCPSVGLFISCHAGAVGTHESGRDPELPPGGEISQELFRKVFLIRCMSANAVRQLTAKTRVGIKAEQEKVPRPLGRFKLFVKGFPPLADDGCRIGCVWSVSRSNEQLKARNLDPYNEKLRVCRQHGDLLGSDTLSTKCIADPDSATALSIMSGSMESDVLAPMDLCRRLVPGFLHAQDVQAKDIELRLQESSAVFQCLAIVCGNQQLMDCGWSAVGSAKGGAVNMADSRWIRLLILALLQFCKRRH